MCVFGHEQLKDPTGNDKAFYQVLMSDTSLFILRSHSHDIGLEYGDSLVNRCVSRKIVANVEHPRRMER